MRVLLTFLLCVLVGAAVAQESKVKRYFKSETPSKCLLVAQIKESHHQGKCLSQVVSLYLSSKDSLNTSGTSVFQKQMHSDTSGLCVFEVARTGTYMLTTGCGKFAVGMHDGINVRCPAVTRKVVLAPRSYCGVTLWDGVDSSEAIILSQRSIPGSGYQARKTIIRGVEVWLCTGERKSTGKDGVVTEKYYVVIDRKTGEMLEQGTSQVIAS